ncbi:hypothetical protein HPB50_018204 [Hyalomma asiaticum]|uniref:Uncharacterized protein n=1 Tax=Hyalomma asiaticum TaxID=266040 RepID=A0ACB7TJF0_HYAAI|nr:hypothetical protein HPB50_018204 [Hyalomma asiaticum]
MATRQRHGAATTGPGRCLQQLQQSRQEQRAEHHSQAADGQEDQNGQGGIYDVPVGLVMGPFVGPFVAQPILYFPDPPEAYYHPVMLQHEPYISYVEHGAVVAGPEYVQLLEGSMLWSLYGQEGGGEVPPQGTGEPHQVTYVNTPQHMMGPEEGHGDAQQNPTAAEANLWQELGPDFYGLVVTSYGNVSVMLKHCVRVDISVHGAVRVVNFPKHCSAAINSSGQISCVCHPCGRVRQEGGSVHMATGTRLAQISMRGVTFTAFNHALVYLVDESGTKSTTENFEILSYDIPLDVFAYEVPQGAECFDECFRIMREAELKTNRHRDDVWLVNGIRIKQTPWGDVQVSRDSGRRIIWTSPTAGTISVNTPIVKAAMSCDPRKFFFVKAGQKRLSADSEAFIVRNGSQRAGFDSRDILFLP